jgi:hypothetical protein
MHALRRGYQAKIFPYNLTKFDTTWWDLDFALIAKIIKAQLSYKSDFPGFKEVTSADQEYLS